MIFFKSLLPILFTTLLLSFSTSNDFTYFSGRWHAETATASFDLKLTQIKGRVSGSHCAIQLGGRKVDCVMDDKYVAITGTANNSASMLVTFISQFYQKKGTASITKINDSTIQWKILSKPKGEYYLPNQMVLRRR
jgi:hypothetical protein